MTFSDFRPPVKVLFVLVAVGTALGIYQFFSDPPLGPISAILRVEDIFIAFFLIFGIFRRIKAAYWVILAIGVLSVAALVLKAGFALRMGGLDSEIVQYLAIYYAMPILSLFMAATYGVRRHFRLVERKD